MSVSERAQVDLLPGFVVLLQVVEFDARVGSGQELKLRKITLNISLV